MILLFMQKIIPEREKPVAILLNGNRLPKYWTVKLSVEMRSVKILDTVGKYHFIVDHTL